ncbi:MAG: hypothetical protein AAGG48_22920 [Planctomycetota bacterium]
MKKLGALVLLLGLLGTAFAVLAHWELRAAAMSETPPSADSLPLTKIVCPELFDEGSSATRPAELANVAFRRILIVGGASFFAATLGVLLLTRRRRD